MKEYDLCCRNMVDGRLVVKREIEMSSLTLHVAGTLVSID